MHWLFLKKKKLFQIIVLNKLYVYYIKNNYYYILCYTNINLI